MTSPIFWHDVTTFLNSLAFSSSLFLFFLNWRHDILAWRHDNVYDQGGFNPPWYDVSISPPSWIPVHWSSCGGHSPSAPVCKRKMTNDKLIPSNVWFLLKLLSFQIVCLFSGTPFAPPGFLQSFLSKAFSCMKKANQLDNHIFSTNWKTIPGFVSLSNRAP